MSRNFKLQQYEFVRLLLWDIVCCGLQNRDSKVCGFCTTSDNNKICGTDPVLMYLE